MNLAEYLGHDPAKIHSGPLDLSIAVGLHLVARNSGKPAVVNSIYNNGEGLVISKGDKEVVVPLLNLHMYNVDEP